MVLDTFLFVRKKKKTNYFMCNSVFVRYKKIKIKQKRNVLRGNVFQIIIVVSWTNDVTYSFGDFCVSSTWKQQLLFVQ